MPRGEVSDEEVLAALDREQWRQLSEVQLLMVDQDVSVTQLRARLNDLVTRQRVRRLSPGPGGVPKYRLSQWR